MQEGLALPSAAEQIARFAMPPNLLHVPAHGFPALDLTEILLRHSPA